MADDFPSLFDSDQNFNQQNQPGQDDPFEMSPELSQYLDQMHGKESTYQKEIQVDPISKEGVRNFMRSSIDADFNLPKNPFKGAQRMIGDFQNPNISQQFLERYRIHPHYDDLGFNPFRDNETLYNEKSSTFDEIRRASGQWVTLAGLSLKDAFGFGEITDQDVARKYQKATSLGQSSKGGFGGFMTNTFLSSGFTVGIMCELAIEEVAMALAEVGLGYLGVWSGGSTAGAMGALALRMGVRAEKAMSTIAKVYKTSTSLLKTLDATKDINKARKFYQAASKVGNFLNPLDNSVDFLRNYDKFKDMNNLAKTAKGFGSFYSDIRNIRLAFGEGSMEGGFVQNDMQKDLYTEFVANHDRQPTLEEMNQMKIIAKQAGATTTLINTPMILLSNKMLFGGLMHGKFRGLTADIWKVAGKKVILNPKYGTKGVKELFTEIPKGYFATKLAYIKNPKLILTQGLKYASANISEGTQEVLQDVISGASKDYYKAAYKADVNRGGYMNYVATHLGKQMNAQGLETFASGFAMAGFVHPISTVISAATQGKEGYENSLAGEIGGYIRDKAIQIQYKNDKTGKWDKYKAKQTEIKAKKEERYNQIKNDLNDYFADPAKYHNPALINLVEQKKYQEAMDVAIKSGDLLEYNDIKDAALVRAVSTAVRLGHMDTFIERIDDMLKMSDEDLKESFPNREPAEHRKVLEESRTKAKSIQKRWDKYTTMRQNPFSANKYRQGTREYDVEATKQIAWDNAVDQMVVNGYTFDQALDRQSSILENIKTISGLENTPYSELNTVFGVTSLEKEIELLETKEIPVLEEGIKNLKEPTKTKEVLKEKKETLKLLKQFNEAITKAVDTDPADDGEIKPEHREAVGKALTTYINHIAGKNKDFVKNDALVQTINGVIDYWRLGYRASAANSAVNILLDPENFKIVHEKIYETLATLHKDRKTEIQKSIDAFILAKDSNDMLNELFDEGITIAPGDMVNLKKALDELVSAGIAFQPEQIEALMREGKIPTEFYIIDKNGNWQDEVIKTGPQYKKALSILNKYIKGITGIDITEEIKSPYYTKARKKSQNDTRTYEELAKQFKFNPTAEESKVLTKDVLQTIIDSDYATDREKALATELLNVTKDDDFVTFSNKETKPNTYSEDKQSIVDARYSAQNYKYQGTANPLEFYILRGEIQRHTQNALKTDTVFAEKIKKLYDTTKEAFNKLSEKQKKDLSKGQLLEGLNSIEAFVDNAMTNETFQSFLAKVKTTETTSGSPWTAFINTVLENIKKILLRKRPVSNTVLNVALDVISTKIAGVTPISPGTEQTGVEPIVRTETVSEVEIDAEPMTEAEYNLFKKTGKVSNSRINYLAEKLIQNKQNVNKLNNYEQLVYKKKEIKKEVDKIIQASINRVEGARLHQEAIDLLSKADSLSALNDARDRILSDTDYLIVGKVSVKMVTDLYKKRFNELRNDIEFDNVEIGSTVILYNTQNTNDEIGTIMDKDEDNIYIESNWYPDELEVVTRKNFKKRIKMVHQVLKEEDSAEVETVDMTPEEIKAAEDSLNNEPTQKNIKETIDNAKKEIKEVKMEDIKPEDIENDALDDIFDDSCKK